MCRRRGEDRRGEDCFLEGGREHWSWRAVGERVRGELLGEEKDDRQSGMQKSSVVSLNKIQSVHSRQTEIRIQSVELTLNRRTRRSAVATASTGIAGLGWKANTLTSPLPEP